MEAYCEIVKIAGSARDGMLVLAIAGGVAGGLALATDFWGTGNPVLGSVPAAVFFVLIAIVVIGC